MAATRSINMAIGCEDCTHADCYGRNCKYGLMFPVLVFMGGYPRCPKHIEKTTEQKKEQYEILYQKK